MNIKIIYLGLLVLSIWLLLGCTYPNPDNNLGPQSKDLQNQLDFVEKELSEARQSLITIQENLEYVRRQRENTLKYNEDLQETYNSLLIDWQNCYAADLCLYYPSVCVDWVFTNFEVEGYSAEELHYVYSDACEASDRDWDKYYGFYTDGAEEPLS